MIRNSIDKLHIEDLNNDIHPSIFDENKDYDMFILRIPFIEQGVSAHSYGFIITHDVSYYFNKKNHKFEKLEDRFSTIHTILDLPTDLLLSEFEHYKEHIIDMEESLYLDKHIPDFMTTWLGLKRDILRIERILHRSIAALQRMISYYEEMANFPINKFVDIHEHLDRTMRSAVLHLSKLDYIYNFHNARTNEKMNKQIYILTILSGIFLPLNLMVGFFGMNTSGLPYTEGVSGTVNVIMLMLSLTLITTLLFTIWRRKS